jgi:hypothetical protein
MSYTSGTPKAGRKVATTEQAEIENVLYELKFKLPSSIAWAIPDYLIDVAVHQVYAVRDLDVIFVEVLDDGTITVQGTPTHNSPVLILIAAIATALAGIGLYVTFQGIWKVLPTPREVGSTVFPGTIASTPGGRPSGASPLSGWILLALVGAGIWFFFLSH